MSELNGDKARFQRQRKAKVLRRERARAFSAQLKRGAGSQPSTDNEQTGGARGRLHALESETPGAADA